MKVKEALQNGLLQLVPLVTRNGRPWPDEYKGKAPVDPQKLMGKEAALVNVQGMFLYDNDTSHKDQTFTIFNRKGLPKLSVFFINDKEKQQFLNPKDYRRGKWSSVLVNAQMLDAEIATVDLLGSSILTFAGVLMKVIQRQSLTDVEVSSIVTDPRTYEVLGDELDSLLVIPGVAGGDLGEIVNHSSTRARLLLYERGAGVAKPQALKLFNNELLNKGVVLK